METVGEARKFKTFNGMALTLLLRTSQSLCDRFCVPSLFGDDR
ncbi:hypothetical protein [Scytonema sp. UIC 10036]|nr:hypothetical protein [Scytonema sp. UIC 10036]